VVVVRHEFLARRRKLEPRIVRKRALDIEQSARPMLAHGERAELVVLGQAFPLLVLVDEVDDPLIKTCCIADMV